MKYRLVVHIHVLIVVNLHLFHLRFFFFKGRVTHELVAIGAQCKGEHHEQTIGRQR